MRHKSRQPFLAGQLLWIVWIIQGLVPPGGATGNGGPFVIQYPHGDPAAKGTLARLDADLKPAREERLRVVEEHLNIRFEPDIMRSLSPTTTTPKVSVTAEYLIENPTAEAIEIDFGFPILRGIYINPYAMSLLPSVRVQCDQKFLPVTIISNSYIYGVIRQRARETIEQGIAGDPELARRLDAIRSSSGQEASNGRQELIRYLTQRRQWDNSDAVLLAEYAGLDLETLKHRPPDRPLFVFFSDPEMAKLANDNLGPLAAIGEQKATQFFARLAWCFDPEQAGGYEEIFKAWGGDVREQAVDLASGRIRPREIQWDDAALAAGIADPQFDPTLYVRVEYLDPRAPLTEREKAACQSILKHLRVIFTFAPMNILYYRATFAAQSTQTITVSYQQHAYADTRAPQSYQLAYVLHPASRWSDFGPIHLQVQVPADVGFRASVPCRLTDTGQTAAGSDPPAAGGEATVFQTYQARLQEKTGELFLAVDQASWTARFGPDQQRTARNSRPR
ncbi:MAG: hypothetical protein JW810_09495 [Sedimentisphaerales bacterium]|nr:hypothetical protein [Sedimentisphaerales bacterium]